MPLPQPLSEKMAMLNSDPPSYSSAPTFSIDGELPEYSRNAAADERIVDAQPCAPRPSRTVAPIEYVFKSDRMELNMGLKRFPVKVPCYGRHGVVSGTVLVKDFKAATKITITVCTFS
jgi:hypothetical protein